MKRIFLLIYKIITFLISLSLIWVFILKYSPLPITPVMIINIFADIFDTGLIGINREWVNYSEISPNFFRALMSAEDGRFMRHNGFDWDAIRNAQRYNEAHKGKKKRGASTISMQTSKNVFLWHSRNYVRKAFEVYFTVLIEDVWGKKRILEMYANAVEFGDGLYGVEAASQRYFGKSASSIDRREAALLVAVLPNPHRWTPDKPTDYIMKRVAFIEGRMGGLGTPKE